MFETLILIGLACIIAAVVGGGLKLAKIEIPLIASTIRQILLAIVGLGIIVGTVVFVRPVGSSNGGDGPKTSSGEPTLTLSRASGPPGTSLTVGGTGFAPGETVAIRFHVVDMTKAKADGQGSFGGQTIVIPANWTPEGQFSISAIGETSSRSANEPFEVPRPTLNLSPASGPPGTEVTVTGMGFAVAESVEIELHLERLTVVQADGEGAISATVVIPADWPFAGQFDIRATGETSRRTVRVPFDVK